MLDCDCGGLTLYNSIDFTLIEVGHCLISTKSKRELTNCIYIFCKQRSKEMEIS